ncbi:calcium-binding protein [Caulobacter sp. UC70_42]|uniref:calcium-binding protein n=1 Tax=Caulobacter sp. UC70_42 TaxID=3374551 RepID=UPI003756CEFF
MGEILAFSPRPPASDWSANERGLLMLLTQQLEAAYGEVDGIFGQTDSGDPWYVVTDSNQDVLVHIARIDGQFVVHDAAIDMFHQVGSLWGALRQVLASGIPEQSGTVVAFDPASREAQSFLSLVIAVGLYLEMRGADLGEAGRLTFENLPRADDPAIETLASKLIAALNLESDRTQAHTPAAVAGEALPPPAVKPQGAEAITIQAPSEAPQGLSAFKISHLAATPAPEPQQAWASGHLPPTSEDKAVVEDVGGQGLAATRTVMVGTAGADVMYGTAGGDTIRGGAGDDYIDGRGAPKGEVDHLDGGEGADRIVMNARAVATGGTGADTFLISAARPADKLAALLGVVLDYSAAKGDHLAVMGEGRATVVSTAAVSNVLAAQVQALNDAALTQATDVSQAVSGARVGFDIDGDGREDVFILLGGANSSTFRIGTMIANDHTAAPEVPLIGQPSNDAGHFGDAPVR